VYLPCCIIAIVITWGTEAFAQAITAVDQIPQRPSSNATIVGPTQVARGDTRDRTRVAQLPTNLSEKNRAGAPGEATPKPDVAVTTSRQLNLGQGRNAGSVDADEIARLLDRGEAASIDAAAAIASGVASADPAPEPELERERREPLPHGFARGS
jgi:hypothetical protein